MNVHLQKIQLGYHLSFYKLRISALNIGYVYLLSYTKTMMDSSRTIFPTKTISLPKMLSQNNFRIRSVSKTKIKEYIQNTKVSLTNKRNEYNRIFIKSPKKRRTRSYKTNTNISLNSEQSEQKPNKLTCKLKIKTNKTIDRDQDERSRTEDIAKLFDPKTIMKMGRKNKTELSQNDNTTHKQKKGYIRMRQYVLDENRPKGIQEHKNNEQFWRKVDESLILNSNMAEQYVSRDLNDIYKTLTSE